MEGILYKWTNYISGWQPRWFVLEGGTLSYYDSQEDAWKGCKGSIKISVCEIQVHSSDSTRLDLTIPSEQYFYLRAINAAERQKWLVALGTAKACLTDNRTKREKELQENTEALKTKMSELRLYCDLLLQQVNKMKDDDNEPDVAGETGLDTSDMVKSTCTTFLKTLEECMQIANRTFMPDASKQSPPASPPVAAIKPQKIKHVSQLNHHLGEKWQDLPETNVMSHETRSLDADAEGPDEPDGPERQSFASTNGDNANQVENVAPLPPVSQNAAQPEVTAPTDGHKEQNETHKRDNDVPRREEVSTEEEAECEDEIFKDSAEPDEPVETFFSTMSHRQTRPNCLCTCQNGLFGKHQENQPEADVRPCQLPNAAVHRAARATRRGGSGTQLCHRSAAVAEARPQVPQGVSVAGQRGGTKHPLSPQSRLRQDSSPVSRMGGPRSLCVGATSRSDLRRLYGCLGVDGRPRAEEQLCHQHAQRPRHLPARHGQTSGHTGRPLRGI
ncbi:pleckstrin homology domain-containing family A member 8 isoform X2 [Corythoichthys intestinalis]|uniref:pleckstrin homology domain-containing family A member 8 isoform X2 n=1 Tax=Corythoichthys intestinalis TaxID=161448 RepID=UPI0025A5A446|nr:pleckstrin homology domain-containing family A member 8 isoform X2 [Corythoichthys intestinalis]